ncbi:MAG: transposase, partial [Bacteroidetes bacterium]|nr:transposase [Bacteroidota bacterium]
MVEIYGYVIMSNHIHLLWTMLNDNGKETPAGSFSKYTAHKFLSYLQTNNPEKLMHFKVLKRDRSHQFWKRDPLAIEISGESIFLQKLEYIHNNPV